MRRRIPWFTAILFTVVLLAAYLRVRPHTSIQSPAPAMAGEPRLMLWAWETNEDLRSLDPSHAGVAYLSRELLLGSTLQVRTRHQPLLLPPGIFLTAVVRIETTPAFPWRTADIPSLAAHIADAAGQPGTRALQVDFDARASERPFYAALLRELRRQLPATKALSITALTSWCGRGSWLHPLPIDEAVPMFFRMGGPTALRAVAPRTIAGIQEPLCTGSAGVATDERWPTLDAGQRVYLFRPGPWRPDDLASVNAGRYASLQASSTSVAQGPTP